MTSHTTDTFLDELQLDNPVENELRELYHRVQKSDTPSDVAQSVKRVCEYVNKRDKYAASKTTPISAPLRKILDMTHSHPWEELYKAGTVKHQFHVVWLSDILQVQILQFLIKMQQAKRVLEVGMFTGFTALGMAEAVPEDGVVVTCDNDLYLEKIARENFNQSPHGNKIEIRIGKGKTTLLDLLKEGQTFDFVYLDANHLEYPHYFDTLTKKGLLAPNGTIAVDNTFGYGHVITRNSDCEGTEKFIDMITNDSSLEQVFLPLRDGIMLIRRK